MSKIKILIVEDEQLMAMDLKEKLEDMGFIVTGITDTAEQTIENIKETHPDLIIMDIVIEGNIDGIETVNRIRQIFDIPVIYLTAFADEETMHRAKLTEPFAYLVKPYNDWELKFTIEIATYKYCLEKDLSESEKSYRTLAGNLPAIVYRFHIKGGNRVEFFNDMFRELTGYGPGDLTFGAVSSMGPLLVPEDEERVAKTVEQAIKKSVPFQIDYRIKHKDGTIRYFHERGKPVLSEKDEVLFVDGVIFDITERKLTEAALQKERDRAQLYLDAARVVMVVINRDHKVELINRKGCAVLGYREEEITGKNWFENFLPKKEAGEVEKVFSLLIKGEVEPVEYYENPVLDKNGEERLIAWRNTLLKDEKGRITGVLSSGLDISERKRMAEEMQKTEKLESLGLLAGGIAHDFNNILAAIMINISLSKLYIDNKDKALERLKEAGKAVNRAQKLTQQLLTFSKGGVPIIRLTSITELLRDTAEFALSGSNVLSDFSIPGGLWHVKIDPDQVSQVFQNMIMNAGQAMPDGGVIDIGAENEIIKEETKLPVKEGKYIKISIRDSGIGIPVEHLNKIFDPFFSTKQKGSGLGLSTAYSIIKNHDGLITVTSELGKGTTFVIYLPASDKKAKKRNTESLKDFSGQGKILLMDDEKMLLEATGQLMQKIGYTVVTARDGYEAVQHYKEALEAGKPFDLVILDLIVSGGMGGKETIGKLLEIDPDVKAVVSSGYSTDAIMADFREYGFTAAVSKPYKPEQLREILQQVLGPGEEKSGKKKKGINL
jgi:PAS domain S-box-containing protein